MPRVFSYGSLQQVDVQLATRGGPLTGRADEIVGFERGITYRGARQFANLVHTGRTDARVGVVLASGAEAWVCVHAPAQVPLRR